MYDIPVGFHFRVTFGANSPEDESRFQEVAGLTAEVTVEELREGGLNRQVHRLPTGVKYGNLVLKRGMMPGSDVVKWCRDALENFSFSTKDVSVALLNEDHEELAKWSFLNAYPIKWAVSDFKAQDSSLVIETLELAYGHFRRVT